MGDAPIAIVRLGRVPPVSSQIKHRTGLIANSRPSFNPRLASSARALPRGATNRRRRLRPAASRRPSRRARSRALPPARIAEPEMGPRQLAAGVATADRQLAPLHAVADATSIQPPIALRFGPSWIGLHLDPVAERRRVVPPKLCGRVPVDDQKVDGAVEVEVGERRAARLARSSRCRALSPISTNLPSARCIRRLFGSFWPRSPSSRAHCPWR